MVKLQISTFCHENEKREGGLSKYLYWTFFDIMYYKHFKGNEQLNF